MCNVPQLEIFMIERLYSRKVRSSASGEITNKISRIAGQYKKVLSLTKLLCLELAGPVSYANYNSGITFSIKVYSTLLRNTIVSKFCSGIFGREAVKLGLILALLGGVSLKNEHTKIRGQSHVLLVG